jgi:hypothetical protein
MKARKQKINLHKPKGREHENLGSGGSRSKIKSQARESKIYSDKRSVTALWLKSSNDARLNSLTILKKNVLEMAEVTEEHNLFLRHHFAHYSIRILKLRYLQ